MCVSGVLVNKIPAERMHRFGRGFRLMVAYRTRTGSNPIELGDLGSKVKVTVTENVCKNDEKSSPKIHIKTFFKSDLIIRLEMVSPSF